MDTDRSPQLRQQFQIRTVPTLILFAGGEPQERSEAATMEEVLPVLRRWLD